MKVTFLLELPADEEYDALRTDVRKALSYFREGFMEFPSELIVQLDITPFDRLVLPQVHIELRSCKFTTTSWSLTARTTVTLGTPRRSKCLMSAMHNRSIDTDVLSADFAGLLSAGHFRR